MDVSLRHPHARLTHPQYDNLLHDAGLADAVEALDRDTDACLSLSTIFACADALPGAALAPPLSDARSAAARAWALRGVALDASSDALAATIRNIRARAPAARTPSRARTTCARVREPVRGRARPARAVRGCGDAARGRAPFRPGAGAAADLGAGGGRGGMKTITVIYASLGHHRSLNQAQPVASNQRPSRPEPRCSLYEVYGLCT
jgi:hypothetical protein